MQYSIKLHINDTERTISAGEGADLLRLLQNNGVAMNTPCAGKGTCGKCAVRVRGDLEAPPDKEKSLLGAEKLGKGFRLACYTHVSSDLDVYLEGDMRDASIITAGKMRDVPLEPYVRKQYIELEAPSLEDQKPDLERVLEALEANPKIAPGGQEILTETGAGEGGKSLPDAVGSLRVPAISGSLDLMKELPSILKTSGCKITAVLVNGRLAAIEPGDTTGRIYGIAVDIGTTTVAAYLYDLVSGKRVSTGSMLNPQRKYGADVISRIDHAIRSEKGAAELQSLIAECISGLATEMAASAGIGNDDIYAAVFAGNTTMLHLLLGLNPAAIATAPFIPVTTGTILLPSKDLGLTFNRYGTAAVFPGVSAYIGGDIVASILSSGIYEEEGISLLVDIGTNGEIVLGGREWLLACSTAAGPAFEGANIKNGMGGVTGAIDSVGPAPDFAYSVIGNAKPAGICGSGIVDAIASLLNTGVLDETGRMSDANETAAVGDAAKRLIDFDGSRAFVLSGGTTEACAKVQAESNNQACGTTEAGKTYKTGSADPDEPIVITQRDVREIQNAKAAIAAGIDTLIREAGISQDDIRRVYLAGGFGSSLHIRTAIRIGLLPKALENRIEAIGNASGAGAAEGLLSVSSIKAAVNISRRVRYIELSASAYFTEKYVENMLF